jgi:O-antigen ligase
MKTLAPFSPRFLIPLTLLTPYVFVLHYGISVLELVVWAFIFAVLLPTVAIGELRLPRYLLIFLLLMTIGYLGALVNGIAWNVPIGIWNLNYFYKLLLGIGAFYIGMRYQGDMRRIFQGRLVLFSMVALGAIAIIYPFLGFDTKVKYFGIFYLTGSDFEKYLTDRRMPGLGLNANVYAFIVYSYLLFSFRAFLQGKISFVIPLVAFLVILVLSSKLVIALSIATCAVLIMRSSLHFLRSDSGEGIRVMFGKRGTLVGTTIGLILVAIIIAATQTDAGKRLVDSYATVHRFQAILAEQAGSDDPKGFALRFELWNKGLDRVELAPVLGIAKDPFIRLAGTLAGFYNPHNEFLRMWMLYGLAGLVAWLYMLGYMVYKNIRHKADFEWLIFYGALAVFMMFDGGIDGPRVNVYLFLMLGLNWSQIRRARYAPGSSPSPVRARRDWVPST